MWTEYSPSEIVKTMGVPGLLIHGAKDSFVPPRHAADLHANWPGSTLEMVYGVGHFDIVGSPQVRTLVTAYLQGVE